MSTPPSLKVIADTNSLFVYPIASNERLDAHSWFTFLRTRWMGSDFRVRADLDVKGAFWELIAAAHGQSPVGTLPVDEDLLADKAYVSLDTWRKLVARPVGPLYGWKPCRCDTGEIRLYHEVVLEVVQDAVKGRRRKMEGAEAERERKRLKELPNRILLAGGSERQAADEAYKSRLDQYLLDNLPEGRNRTPAVVRAAMEAMELGEVRPL